MMATLKAMFKLFDGYSSTIDKINRKTDEATNKILNASGATDKFNNKLNNTGASANKANNGLNRLVKTIIGLKAVRDTINLTDEMTLTAARLDLINDGLQTTKQLQDMIFASAQRARGEYISTAAVVSKLGLLAGKAFGSNKEIIAFAETFQKMAIVSGSSLSETTNAMYQLTQAMASGRLQGDEFRSIIENAPMLAQAIEKYLKGQGVKGTLKDMASDGLITAQVIKNAMFSVVDDVNAKFAEMPMTFGQAWTIIKNSFLNTFTPVLQTIAKGAIWIGDNWKPLEPIFYGVAAAVGAYTIAMAANKAITWLAVDANKALIVTMLSNPWLWVAVGIGILVGEIYKWAQSVGGLKIAWQIAVDKILTGWDLVKLGFMSGVYAVQDFIGQMKVGVLMSIEDMVNGAIDLINKLIATVNKIPGISLDTIDKVSFAATAKIEYETDKASRISNLLKMKMDADTASAHRKYEISLAKQQAAADKASASSLFDFPLQIEGTGANGSVKVNMDDEDLKYLRDIAEREYINKFSTATLAPNIQISFGDVHEEADADKLVGRIKRILQEEIATAAEGAYA